METQQKLDISDTLLNHIDGVHSLMCRRHCLFTKIYGVVDKGYTMTHYLLSECVHPAICSQYLVEQQLEAWWKTACIHL